MGRTAVLMAVAMVMVLAAAATCGADPPEGNGLAANYPGDVGIQEDPAVVFVENFEEASLADMLARWDDVGGIMSLVSDVPPASSGAKSLLMTHMSTDEGGMLYNSFPEGYDQLYVRYYCKFSDPSQMVHHFVHLGGYNPPTPWPQGGAGTRPVGDDRFGAAFEPNGCSCPDGYIWAWDSYNYWMGMHQSPDNYYWGNGMMWGTYWMAPQDQWICVEFMVKMNDPVSSSNGEMVMWVNGQLLRKDSQIVSWLRQGLKGSWTWGHFTPDASSISTFEGFQWRNTTALQANYLWLLYYMDTGGTGTVEFDDVVLATQYIGPMVPAGPMPEVVLEDHPNERAPGVASSTLLGKTPWTNPVSLSAPGYWWKTYRFAASGVLWIQICGQNFSGAQNGYNDGDDMKLMIDGVVPNDYDGIQRGALGGYQWKGSAEKGERWTLRFLALNQGGLHSLRLAADQAPILWWVKVTDLTEQVIYP